MIQRLRTAIRIAHNKGFWALAQTTAKSLDYYWKVFYVAPRIQMEFNRVSSNNWAVDRLVDYAATVGRGLIKPQQNRQEIIELLNLLRQLKPSSVIEIGAARGGTLFLWSRISTSDAVLITVDQLIPDWRRRVFALRTT